MNEILAVVLVCLASEIVVKHQDDVTDDASDEEDNVHAVERTIF